jgi:hypothetical protein
VEVKPIKWLISSVVAVAAVLALSAPVSAGGWATTLLDPMPPITAGESYTVTFWILQHGSHVSMLTLNNPGLKFVPESGESVIFKGTPVTEGGRYSTVLRLPHGGPWEIIGMQSPFQDFKVGLLNIPGGLRLERTPPPLGGFSPDPSWVKAQPPLVNDQGQPELVAAAPAAARPEADKAAWQPAAPRGSGPSPAAWPALLTLLALGAAGAIAVRLHRARAGIQKPQA